MLSVLPVINLRRDRALRYRRGRRGVGCLVVEKNIAMQDLRRPSLGEAPSSAKPIWV